MGREQRSREGGKLEQGRRLAKGRPWRLRHSNDHSDDILTQVKSTIINVFDRGIPKNLFVFFLGGG